MCIFFFPAHIRHQDVIIRMEGTICRVKISLGPCTASVSGAKHWSVLKKRGGLSKNECYDQDVEKDTRTVSAKAAGKTRAWRARTGGVPAPGGAWTALCPAREEMFDLRRDVMQSTAWRRHLFLLQINVNDSNVCPESRRSHHELEGWYRFFRTPIRRLLPACLCLHWETGILTFPD